MKRSPLKLKTLATIFMLVASLVATSSTYAMEYSISGNGAESESVVDIELNTQVTVVQENEATVENNVEVESNTGDNVASGNNGNVSIETGNTVTEIDVNNEVNTSVTEVECCVSDQILGISDNGESSENEISVVTNTTTNLTSNQTVNISNNISGSSNTGDNSAEDNVGEVLIETGDIHVEGSVGNSANSSSVSSSTGLGGEVSVKISNNGASSTNSISLVFEDDDNAIVNNTAEIINNVDWNLNTGGNEASGNVGDVSFLTGDIFYEFAIYNDPLNMSGIDIGCCAIYDPDDEEEQESNDDGGNGGDNNGGDSGSSDSNDGNGDSSDDGGGDGGTLLAAAASTELLGLSATSSEEQKGRAFWIGFILLSLGVKLLGDVLQRYNTLQINYRAATARYSASRKV